MMQPVRPSADDTTNTENNQDAFWTDVMRIALQGEDRPASLTEDEIRRICRLTLVALPKRVVLAKGAAITHSQVPQ